MRSGGMACPEEPKSALDRGFGLSAGRCGAQQRCAGRASHCARRMVAGPIVQGERQGWLAGRLQPGLVGQADRHFVFRIGDCQAHQGIAGDVDVGLDVEQEGLVSPLHRHAGAVCDPLSTGKERSIRAGAPGRFDWNTATTVSQPRHLQEIANERATVGQPVLGSDHTAEGLEGALPARPQGGQKPQMCVSDGGRAGGVSVGVCQPCWRLRRFRWLVGRGVGPAQPVFEGAQRHSGGTSQLHRRQPCADLVRAGQAHHEAAEGIAVNGALALATSGAGMGLQVIPDGHRHGQQCGVLRDG